MPEYPRCFLLNLQPKQWIKRRNTLLFILMSKKNVIHSLVIQIIPSCDCCFHENEHNSNCQNSSIDPSVLVSRYPLCVGVHWCLETQVNGDELLLFLHHCIPYLFILKIPFLMSQISHASSGSQVSVSFTMELLEPLIVYQDLSSSAASVLMVSTFNTIVGQAWCIVEC